VFADNAAIQTWRRGLLGELQALAARRAPFSLSGLQACDFHPSFNLAFHGSDERPLREAYARLFSHCFPRETARSSAGRPRVGIVVTDRHETIFLRSLGGVLERLNSEQFELVVIGSRRGVATMRPAIRNPAVAMLPLPGPIEQAATAIRAAQFDLLYYWEVGTDATNYLLPFFRLAPVQCTSWGIQVTSGIPQLDYYISSELVEPPDGQEHYSERLVLASTLLTCQPRRTLEGAPKSRAALGIEPDCHLYLCAQQLGKFHPDFDPILAAILRRDLRATLLITEDRHGGFIARDLRARFSASMPDVAERIMFVPYQQSHDYMSLVAAADVLLDPPHFGGVNSSYDGFSLNRPIVTLPSRFQRGRYTWACYKKMGVIDCVASSAEHYVDIAVALGSDAEYRAAIADKIREASGVLFDDLAAVREHERIWSALVAQARSLAGATHP
jgi:predicted O-linked N-acetylglucosamine transferase (SPINDLY family)